MASSSRFLSEDQLLCSICLDVFTEPVSTPCGHNFCKKCLAEYWDSRHHWLCPLCNKSFDNRPDLSVNTFISETAAQFRKSKQEIHKITKDLCDACIGVKEKSVKFCLNCGASYCEAHLEPHKNIQILKKHKIIDPVENMEDYICQKHERPLELFCRDDQMCVCLFCTVTDHKTHNTVPIEEASGDFKAQLEKTQTQVQKMIQDRLEKTEEIRLSLEFSKKNTEDVSAGGVEVFTALIRSIERSQAELLEVLEEKQKAAERQAEDLGKDLEQEITELKRRDTQLEQVSHAEDHLHLLQVYPSVCAPPHTKNWTGISLTTHSSAEILRTSLSQLQKTLNHEINKKQQTLKQGRQQESAACKWFMSNWKEILLEIPIGVMILLSSLLFVLLSSKMWIQLYEVDVILDPDTANPNLILSDDGKQVKLGDTYQNLPSNRKRFYDDYCVLGKEGFSSGRFYFEVQVSGTIDWGLGVASESVSRNGYAFNPQNGFWVMWLWDRQYTSAGSSVPLSLRQKLQKLGVFVDYEEGLVSFYDVEARCHIYSFTGQSFTEKLYPFLSPSISNEDENSAPLIISDGLPTLSRIFNSLALRLGQILPMFYGRAEQACK